MKQILFLLFLGSFSSLFGQIDLSIYQFVEPPNDTLDFSVEYPGGCFKPEAGIFAGGSGTVNSDEITVCWVVGGGTPECTLYDSMSFSIAWGTNLQPRYPDTICVNTCQSIDLMCYVSYANDPNQSNDTLRITLQDDCPTLVQPELEQGFVSVFPNPAVNELHIELNPKITSLKVFSVDGQVMHTINRPKIKEKINLDSYDAGIYLIQIVSAGRQWTSKFIKY